MRHKASVAEAFREESDSFILEAIRSRGLGDHEYASAFRSAAAWLRRRADEIDASVPVHLTEDQEEEIRLLLRSTELNQREIGDKFGVSSKAVYRIKIKMKAVVGKGDE